jgi:sterol desaturase/sphingolipid hydroxylase (fatty acid hydroxylase superfamily)
MKSFMIGMLLITLVILIVEVLAGRHKGIYRREDWLVIGIPAVLNPFIMSPLAGGLIGWTATKLLPASAGTLAHLPLLPSFLGIFLLTEFCFYWAHRWAHDGKKNGSKLRRSQVVSIVGFGKPVFKS